MSEYTDDIINGGFDFLTGEYLGRGGGFPRSVHFHKKSKKSVFVPNAKTRVVKFLKKLKIRKKNWTQVIRGFFNYNASIISNVRLCELIQEDFEKFKEYVEKLTIKCVQIINSKNVDNE